MFFCDHDRAYSIIGIYHVTREGVFDGMENGRSFTSLGIRIRGSSVFLADGQKTVAEAGSIVYIPRGVSYRRHTEETEELIILHLVCHGEDDSEISILRGNDVTHLFEQLFAAWESNDDGRHNRCMSLLYRIFETLERRYSSKPQMVPNIIASGVEYLLSNYRDAELSVAQAADISHVSEVYFRRLYRKTYGESPWQTVLELRFNYALECLRSGYYTVKDVAAKAGFSDVKHFRSAFTKRFGMSPTKYSARND